MSLDLKPLDKAEIRICDPADFAATGPRFCQHVSKGVFVCCRDEDHAGFHIALAWFNKNGWVLVDIWLD